MISMFVGIKMKPIQELNHCANLNVEMDQLAQDYLHKTIDQPQVPRQQKIVGEGWLV